MAGILSGAAINTPVVVTRKPSVALTGRNATVTFELDSDLTLAAEDQAKSQGLGLAAWLQQALNDSLRAYLGA